MASDTPGNTPTDHDQNGGNDEQHMRNFSHPSDLEPVVQDVDKCRFPERTYNQVRSSSDADGYRRHNYDGRDRSPMHNRSRRRRRYTSTDSEEVSITKIRYI